MSDYRPAPKRESEIEKKGCEIAALCGWKEWKVVSPSSRGFPDRFYARNGVVVLVEWKRPGESPTAQQQLRHAELRSVGVRVEVIDSLEAARAVFR